MRQRLRALPSEERLAEMYASPHDHKIYGRGHEERVRATIGMACRTIRRLDLDERLEMADLSCGNGFVLEEVARSVPEKVVAHYGDFAPGWELEGPLERTLTEIPNVDLYVCAETLEHLDDPDAVLKQVRSKARALTLSTPVAAWNDTNGEHLWAWSVAEVSLMLENAQWRILEYDEVDTTLYNEGYIYGIWGCI